MTPIAGGVPIRFAALGDSYTVGEGVPPEECWPMQLVHRLRGNGVAVEDPVIVARTGWTAEELAQGIREAEADGRLDAVPFHMVSLLVGVNDQYRGGRRKASARRCAPSWRRRSGWPPGKPDACWYSRSRTGA